MAIWSFEMFFNRPVPIQSSSASRDDACQDHAVVSKEFSEEATKQVLASAKENRQTVNDHLVASCFLSLEDWNGKFNVGAVGSLMRILIATDLRRDGHPVACNKVAMVNIDRTPGKSTFS